MPNEWEKAPLVTPETETPEWEKAPIVKPTREQRLQSFEEANARPPSNAGEAMQFDPEQISTPTTTGYASIPEHVAWAASGPSHALGAVFGAPQRFMATAFHNGLAIGTGQYDKMKGVEMTPDKAQDFGDRLTGFGQYVAAPFKAAVGAIEPGSFETQREVLGIPSLETRPSYWNKDGGLNAGQLLRHFAQGAIDFIGNTAQDPLVLTHPGLTTEGALAKAGRIAEVEKAALSGAKDFIPRDYTTPGLGPRIRAGEVGAQLRAPFVKGPGLDVPIPKAVAPVGDLLDSIGSKFAKADTADQATKLSKLGDWGRAFVEPSSTSVEGVARRLAENRSQAIVRRELQKQLLPIKEKMDAVGFDQATKNALSLGAEIADQDASGLVLRAGTPEMAERLNAQGATTQTRFADQLESRLQKLVDEGHLKESDKAAALAEGQAHFAKQAEHVANALDGVLRTHGREGLAVAYDVMNDLKTMAVKSREIAFTHGVDIPELGGTFRSAPFELLDQIDKLKASGADAGKIAELVKQLPEQLKNYNKVPGYFPGRLSEEAGAAMYKGDARLRQPGKGSGVESAQRSFVHPSGVPFSTFETAQEIARGSGGTAATAGRMLKGAEPTLWEKFLNKTGYTDAKALTDPAFMKLDPVDAWHQYYSRDLYKPLRNVEVDAMYRKMFKTVKPEAWNETKRAALGTPMENGQLLESIFKEPTTEERLSAFKKAGGEKATEAVNKLIREGIEDATPEFKQVSEYEYRKFTPEQQAAYDAAFERVQNAERFGNRRAPTRAEMLDAFEAAGGADALNAAKGLKGAQEWRVARNDVKWTRPATMEELQKVYTDRGGVGKLDELLPERVLKGLESGEMSLADAFKPSATPDGMSQINFHDKSTAWMHEGVARDLDAWKALGENPTKLAEVFPKLGALYSTYLGLWRKGATTHGPQFIAYNLRNVIGDAIRMAEGQMMSPAVIGDITNLHQPMQHYIKTGSLDRFAGKTVDLGPMGTMDASKFMELALEHQVAAGGQIRADIFKGAEKAFKPTIKAGGVVNNAQRAGGWLVDSMAAREDVQRVAGFAERLRRGDTPYMAAMNVENALFNLRRLSPAARFSRDYGLTPFTWPFKNIPFQIQFALENPGAFAAVMRAQEMLQNGDLTDSQLPEWMRSKFNYVVKTRREDNGHLVHSIITDSGANPMNDFAELAAKTSQGPRGTLGWLMQNIGPVASTLSNLGQYYAKDEIKQQEGILPQLAPLVGRPQQSFNKLGDLITDATDKYGNQEGRGMRLLKMAVLPLNAKDVDVTQTAKTTKGMARAAVRQTQAAARVAQRAYEAVVEEANQALAGSNEARLTDDEMRFNNLRNAAKEKKAAIARAKEIRDRIVIEANRAKEAAERLDFAK